MIQRKPTFKETIQKALRGYCSELVVLPGWPQYCVTRPVLHYLVNDSQATRQFSDKHKNWLIAYAQVAGPELVEIAYDEALELYDEAESQT